MEKVERSELMEQVAEEVIKGHPDDLGWIGREGARIAYVTSDKAKTARGRRVMGECRKADATMKELAGCDFVVTFYRPNIIGLSSDQLHVLMYHELLHARMDSGITSLVPHDYVVEDFKKVIEEYGADWDQEGKG